MGFRVKYRTIRFALVGITNAAINFAILNFTYFTLHQNKIVASIVATSFAVLVSFVLNRQMVFKSQGRATRQLVLFVAVTISGVILVQNVVYAASVFLIKGHEVWFLKLVYDLTGIKLAADFIDINASTVFAAILAMVWNYNGYRLFVFKEKKEALDEALAEAI